MLDLTEIPFSFHNSYLSIHDYNETYMSQPDIGNFPVPKPEKGGLTLRLLHIGIKTSFVAHFDYEGYYECNDDELVLRNNKDKCEITFADDETLLFKGNLPLHMDFYHQYPLFQFAYEIKENQYMISSFKNNCRFVLTVQDNIRSNSVLMDRDQRV